MQLYFYIRREKDNINEISFFKTTSVKVRGGRERKREEGERKKEEKEKHKHYISLCQNSKQLANSIDNLSKMVFLNLH